MIATYGNDVFDDGLVDGHLGALQHAHTRADPCDKEELGAFRQFVAGLQPDVTIRTLVIIE